MRVHGTTTRLLQMRALGKRTAANNVSRPGCWAEPGPAGRAGSADHQGLGAAGGTGHRETEIVKIVELLNCYHKLTVCQETWEALYDMIHNPPNGPLNR